MGQVETISPGDIFLIPEPRPGVRPSGAGFLAAIADALLAGQAPAAPEPVLTSAAPVQPGDTAAGLAPESPPTPPQPSPFDPVVNLPALAPGSGQTLQTPAPIPAAAAAVVTDDRHDQAEVIRTRRTMRRTRPDFVTSKPVPAEAPAAVGNIAPARHGEAGRRMVPALPDAPAPRARPDVKIPAPVAAPLEAMPLKATPADALAIRASHPLLDMPAPPPPVPAAPVIPVETGAPIPPGPAFLAPAAPHVIAYEIKSPDATPSDPTGLDVAPRGPTPWAATPDDWAALRNPPAPRAAPAVSSEGPHAAGPGMPMAPPASANPWMKTHPPGAAPATMP